MTWIKLDDSLPNNPKILPLSDAGFRLYIEGLCYANQYLTDGFLAEAVVKRLDSKSAHIELLEAGLWDAIDDGIQIHDYCEHQTSKADVEAKKGQNRDRVMRYKQKNNALLMQPEDRIQKQNTETDTFTEFWSAYPWKVGKKDALKAYAKALKSATPEEILEGAKRYAQDPNREAEYTAHPTTWLNRGSWGDDPLPSKTPQNGFRATFSTPTVLPPRFVAEPRLEAVPMPENLRNILRK